MEEEEEVVAEATCLISQHGLRSSREMLSPQKRMREVYPEDFSHLRLRLPFKVQMAKHVSQPLWSH